MQDLVREGPEVLDQETVAARREYAAADFMPRKTFLFQYDRFKPRVNKTLGACRSRQTGPYDEDINVSSFNVCCHFDTTSSAM
jgi:hypothetical protein